MAFIQDTLLLFRHHLRSVMRNPTWMIVGIIQPVMYLAFFGPLLTSIAGKGIPGFTAANAYNFFVPGLLVQLGLFSTAFVGFGIIADWRAGVIERLRVTPASRLAILAGRILINVLGLVIQSVVLLLAGLAFGLRAPVAGVFIGLGIIAIVAVSLAALSYTVGLLTKSEDVLAPSVNMLILPLMLLSGIMLPMTLGPGWLQGVARATPFRYVVDAIRSSFAGNYANHLLLEGICVSVGMAVVSLWLAGRVFTRLNA